MISYSFFFTISSFQFAAARTPQTITTSAAKQPQEFVDDVVKLIFDYKGDNKLHDDITMMVTKVVG